MRQMEIAMAMICQVDRYHLQHRTGHEKIGASGLVGCFGGKIENGEDPRQAAVRELAQETNISLDPGMFEELRVIDSVEVLSDHDMKPVEIHADVVEILLPSGQAVEAREGKLVTWTRQEIKDNMSRLTPATKEFFKGYFA